MPDKRVTEEIGENEKKECILELRRLLLGDENLNGLQSNDAYLERFLNSTEFDVTAAFQKVKTFYEMLEECPEWFTTGCPLDKKTIIEKNIRIIPDECDRDGRPIYILKVGNMDPSSMDLLEDVVPVDDFYIEMLMDGTKSCSKNGLCVIIDIGNFSLKFMKWLTPHNIKTAVRRMQAMPIKEYRYHVVNNSFMIQTAIRIVWHFLPQHFRDSIVFHFNDWDSLHHHIEQKALPTEYGGEKNITYDDYYLKVFNKSVDIAKSFKITRELYLQNLVKDNNNKE